MNLICRIYEGTWDIHDLHDEVVGHLRGTGWASKGEIISNKYGRKIGTFDSNYWYDSSGRAVAEFKRSMILGDSIRLMKTPYVLDFQRSIFG